MEFVSIGPTCQPITVLRELGLKGPSYPFDAIFSSLEMVKHCIDTNFEIFLDKQYYITGDRPGDKGTKHSIYRKYVENHPLIYVHTKCLRSDAEYTCLHHDLIGKDEHYEAFKRRSARFMDLIRSDKQSVLVYKNTHTPNYDDIIEFSKGMKEFKKVFILGILENQNGQCILYDSDNCRIYQNYNSTVIFEEIKKKFIL